MSVSGNFKEPGEQGKHCSLPQTSDVTISVGDVTVTVNLNKSSGVTQDVPVFTVRDDGTLQRDVIEDDEVRAVVVFLSDH